MIYDSPQPSETSFFQGVQKLLYAYQLVNRRVMVKFGPKVPQYACISTGEQF